MAKTAAQLPKPAEPGPADQTGAGVAQKAAAVAKKVAGLRADLGLAHELAHQAQVREALSRTELTLALGEALRGRAEALSATRRLTAKRYLETAAPREVRHRGPRQRDLDRLLLKAGPIGHARLIADAGIWRDDDPRAISRYVRRRIDPTAAPATLFDQAWYLETCPEAAGSNLAPLVHYLTRGAHLGYSPHPLLHPGAYAAQNASALNGAGVTPLEHFVRAGAALGRNPHPAFDVLYYAAQGPRSGLGSELRSGPELAPQEDPVSHYVRQGWREGLSPHPLFDPAWYRRQMPRQAAETPPLVHYLTTGWREGLSPHPLFDPRWYWEQNPDVAELGAEPLAHFLTSGAAEGRSPSAWFDTPYYVAARGAELDPGLNPLVDYLQGGAWAVTEARPGFPTAAYLAQSPDLVRQGITPLEHWARKAAKLL